VFRTFEHIRPQRRVTRLGWGRVPSRLPGGEPLAQQLGDHLLPGRGRVDEVVEPRHADAASQLGQQVDEVAARALHRRAPPFERSLSDG
jgi:hypothetical protein